MDGRPNSRGRFEHTTHDRATTLGIRNLFSLDAFITLLCLARKGELLDEDPLHSLPALCAYDVFPRVLYRHLPLAHKWQVLYRCIERIYWLKLYGDGVYFKLGIETIEDNLASLRTDPAKPLVMKSGLRWPRLVSANEATGDADQER